MRTTSLLLLASALLAGCGGSGGGSSSAYVGSFTEQSTVAIPSDLGFDPASSGAATATLEDGALRVSLDGGLVLSGTVAAEGTVTGGTLTYPATASTVAGSLPATISVSGSGKSLGVFASVAVLSSASADYTIELRRG